MSENLHNIDHYFKNGLEGHEEAPDSSVWEALDNSLDKVETVHLRHKYTRLKYWSIAITVVLTSALLYLYNAKHALKGNPLEEIVTDSPSILKSKKEANTETNPTPDRQSSKPSANEKELTATVKTIEDAAEKNSMQQNPLSTNKKSELQNKTENKITNNRAFSSLYKTIAKQKNKGLANISSRAQYKTSFDRANIVAKTTTESQLVLVEKSQLYYHSYPKNTGLKEKGIAPEPGYKGVSFNQNVKSLAIKNPITRKNMFAAGIYYSDDKPFQRLEEGRQEHDEDDKNAIMNGETVQSSTNYGVLGSFSLGNKVSIQTGISFNKKISNIAEKQVFARRPDFRNSGDLKFKFNCAAGYTYIDPKTTANLRAGDSIKVTGSTNELSYVELPVLLNYQLGNGRFHVNLLSGISANFLQKGTLQTSLVNSWGTKIPVNTELQGLKKTYFSALLGAGVEYDLFPSLSLYAQEVIKGSLGSINQNAPTKTYANSTGLQLGIRVRL